MVHTAIHWPTDGADELRLWAFAIQHAVWLYNRLPNRKTGLTPLELFTSTQSDHRDLLRSHVWGCPVYVLDPQLAEGKKIPKWNRRSRLGQFLGFSDEHSSLVGRVRNLETNYVSPQYHLVYDDNFSSIFNDTSLQDSKADEIFDDLFENARDFYGEIERDAGGVIIYEPPPLEDIWLSEPERREKKDIVRRRRDADRTRQQNFDREFERSILEKGFNPNAEDALPPDLALVSDNEVSQSSHSSDSSDDSDDASFSGGAVDEEHVPEGARSPLAPNIIPNTPDAPGGSSEGAFPRGSDGTAAPPPRRSKRLRREGYQRALRGLEKHDQFNTAIRRQYSLSLGPKQPPNFARRSPKRRINQQ